MILLGLLKETDEERTFSINEETPFWIFLHGTSITREESVGTILCT